jgi:hypothetical protein
VPSGIALHLRWQLYLLEQLTRSIRQLKMVPRTVGFCELQSFLAGLNLAFNSAKLAGRTLPISGINNQSYGDETQGNVTAAWQERKHSE